MSSKTVMKKMKNEGFVERVMQALISMISFSIAVFWLSGVWRHVLLAFSFVIAIFAAISFCPLYAILKINRYSASGKKNWERSDFRKIS